MKLEELAELMVYVVFLACFMLILAGLFLSYL